MRKIALFCSVFLTACGGSVAPDAASTSNGTPGTTIDSGVSFDAPAIDSAHDSPIETSVIETSIEAARSCTQTRDRVDIRVVYEAGGVTSCDGAPSTFPPTTLLIEGRIVDTTTNTLVLETCPPTADCPTSGRTTLQVTAPGLDLTKLPKTSFVRVEAMFGRTAFSCTQLVEVHSKADWGGVPNPVDTGGKLYLTAVDGEVGTFEELSVTKVAQGCLPGVKSCDGTEVDDFFLRISSGAASVDAYMGEDAPGPLPITPGNSVYVKNLRSFDDGACDAYANYAFWALQGL